MGKIRHMETQLRIKEDEVYKLRQDNSSMFTDLKAFAQGEDHVKQELSEHRNKR